MRHKPEKAYDMADIFISYKRENQQSAALLAKLLCDKGFLVWWDKELIGGVEYGPAIDEELQEAKCVIGLWSKCAVESHYVRAEVSKALERKALICANLDGVELPVPFNGQQQINLRGWDGDPQAPAFQNILRGVAHMLDRPYTSPTPLNRALLIGVGNYKGALHFSSIGDVKDLTYALNMALAKSEGRGFECDVSIDDDSKTVWRKLNDLAKRAEANNELALIYFCGQAKVSADEGVCLLLTDSEPELLEQTTIPLRTLAKKVIDKIHSEQVVVILDCRFSPVEVRKTAIDVAEAIKQCLSSGKGKHLLTATVNPGIQQPDGLAAPFAFTHALIEGLQSWKADLSGDNIITLDEWFDYAKGRLVESECQPEKWSFGGIPGTVEIARRAPPSQTVTARAEDIPLDFLDRVRTRLGQNKIIPFLGDGIFGTGPLSSYQLVAALSRNMEVLKSDVSITLPTAAEYLVQMQEGEEIEDDNKEGRNQFLTKFRAILEAQTKECTRKAIHDLVLNMEPPWLVVSTTHDWVLERRLEEAQRPCVVVSHVLRSRDAGDIRGKILPVRLGAKTKAKPCPAEELRFDEKEKDCVIYKVLGSPFMNDQADESMGIDTVVVTETDHTLLLGRLENRTANVPSLFADPFRLRNLLFFGFRLDLWHYRLIGHLFSKTGPTNLRKRPIALIGKQTPQVEVSFWRLLGADIAQCDEDGFARELLTQMTEA